MNRDVYHTVYFNKQGDTPTRTKQSTISSRLPFLNMANTNNQFSGKNALYLLDNAVGKIYQILKYIERSGPYLNKYGPIIKEVPTMYKLMTALNEIDPQSLEESNQSKNHSNHPKQSKPKLYI